MPQNETTVIELEQEADGRWIAEIKNVPGATIITYGATRLEAVRRALELMDEALEHQHG